MAKRGGIQNGMPRLGLNNNNNINNRRDRAKGIAHVSLSSRPKTPVTGQGLGSSAAKSDDGLDAEVLEQQAQQLLNQFLRSPGQSPNSAETPAKPDNPLKRSFDDVSTSEGGSGPSHEKQTRPSAHTVNTAISHHTGNPAEGKITSCTGPATKALERREEVGENKRTAGINGNENGRKESSQTETTTNGHNTKKSPTAINRPVIPHRTTPAKPESEVSRTMMHPATQHLVNNKPVTSTQSSRPKPPSSPMPQHLNNKPTPAIHSLRHKQSSSAPQQLPPSSRPVLASNGAVHQTNRNISHSKPNKQNTQSDINMPRHTHDRSFSFEVSNEFSLARRASRRTRNAPVNYFAKPPGFNASLSDDEPEVQVEAESPKSTPTNCGISSESVDEYLPFSPKRTYCRLVYQSELLRIIQQPITDGSKSLLPSIVDDADEEQRIPYHNLNKRKESGKLCAKLDFSGDNSSGVIIHVDFDQDEMRTIYSLMTDSDSPNEESLIQDQLAEATKLSARLWRQDMPSYIRRIRRLKSFMKSERLELDTMSEWDQKLDRGRLKKISRRVGDVWDLPLEKGCDEKQLYRNLVEKIDPESLGRVTRHLDLLDSLRFRSNSDISNFINDAKYGALSTVPSQLRAFASGTPQAEQESFLYYDCDSSSALLRSRELGYKVHRGRNKITRTLDDLTTQKWELSKSWKGASGDIVALSWSPDGTRFALGATAHCADNNMQYNRNNNLLTGDLAQGKIRELPDHRIPRPVPRSGPNAGQETLNTADPNLYTSVSAMQWSRCGSRLYTASFDQTVKIWDASTHKGTRCINTLSHPGKVHAMSVSDFDPSLMATGCEADSPMRLWKIDGDHSHNTPLEGISRSGSKMFPIVVSWGSTPASKDLLITGLSEVDREDENTPPRGGLLSLWKIGEGKPISLTLSPNSQAMFDATWHPSMPVFAVGCSVPLAAKSQGFGKDIQSLVRIYDPLHGKCAVQMYQCPALDINEVTFCPTNQNYIAAGCTDGTTYVWDYRNPDTILHKLRHGLPISDLDPDLSREQADVGVRMALWGSSPGQFYTGASDGAVKSWDIRRAPADVFNEDVHRFGEEIMSGALSPDKTNMLIGDACGGVHVLSTAPMSGLNCDGATLHYQGTSSTADPPQQTGTNDEEDDNSMEGIILANKSLSSGHLSIHPEFGPGQGPNYNGPFASWARPNGTLPDQLATTPLRLEIQATQLVGPPVHRRGWLNAESRDHVRKQIKKARSRNQKRTARKKVKREQRNTPLHPLCIDLTGDSDSSFSDDGDSHSSSSEEDCANKEDDGFEEDYWWPKAIKKTREADRLD